MYSPPPGENEGPLPQTYDALVEQLTGPGGPFEIAIEDVNGLPMKNFVRREKSLREKIAGAAQRGGDNVCMVQGDRRISYDQFGKLVWGAGHTLADEFGLGKGDRLAVLAYNCPDWIISLFGATSVGGIGVGLNGWWYLHIYNDNNNGDLEEIQNILKNYIFPQNKRFAHFAK